MNDPRVTPFTEMVSATMSEGSLDTLPDSSWLETEKLMGLFFSEIARLNFRILGW